VTWRYLKGRHCDYGFLDAQLIGSLCHWSFEYDGDELVGLTDFEVVRGRRGEFAISGSALGMKSGRQSRSLKGFLRRIRRCPYFRKGDQVVIRHWYVGCADVLVTL